MENEPEVIRQQMNETRASLAEKLETLEQQVVGTVQGATASVTETVENMRDAVKDTVASVQGSVRETVETVKDTFDLSQAVYRHPWIAVGCSAAAGYFIGSLLRRDSARPQPSLSYARSRSNGLMRARRADSEAPHFSASSANGDSRPNWLAKLVETLGDETKHLRELAIASALGAARDFLIRQVPPNVAPRLAEIVDSAAAKLGGQPIRGSVLPPEQKTSTY
jgi:ElaB/YqjD/DUF883 family membrane-anchored ribosome-binding protein